MNHRFNLSKRVLKRRTLFTSLLLLIISFSSVHAQKGLAKGTVYLDTNANGRYDVGERGIANVKVSNGVDVVKTNAQGQYKIELPPESILFISKPTNYRIPLNEVQLPQFYYRHYPTGTPALAAWKWPVIQPTGTLPKTIDFALFVHREL